MSDTTEPGSYFVANYPPFSQWHAAAVPTVLAALATEATGEPLGLYLHIPFCRKRCKFCYFRVYTDTSATDVERYSQALSREAEMASACRAVAGRTLRYVYFGGGTPSFLSVKQLERLVAGLHKSFGWDHAEEVTFECEPGTLAESKVRALKSLGMTRISLGVENFDDNILETNGRAHLSAEIFRAWEWIKSADFLSTNVDLIAGMMGETFSSWQRTVEKTLAMEADSVTIYQMELPLNTTFVRDSRDTGDPTAVADWPTKRGWVDWAFARFLESGYSISSAYTLVRNSEQVHFRYRDMLWQGSDLVSLGVASFGHISGLHYQNETHWDDYLGAVEAGRLPIQRGYAPSHRELLIREMVLGLKRGELDVARLARKFGIDPLLEWAPQWQALLLEGHLQQIHPWPLLTRQGLLQIDALLPRFYTSAHSQVESVP